MAQPSNRSLLLPLGIIATILVGWVLRVGAPIIQPLVIALLLTGMLSPVVRLLARFRVPPFLSVLSLAGLLLYLAIVGLDVAQRSVRAFMAESDAPAVPAAVSTPQPGRTIELDDAGASADADADASTAENVADNADESAATDSDLVTDPNDGDAASLDGESVEPGATTPEVAASDETASGESDPVDGEPIEDATDGDFADLEDAPAYDVLVERIRARITESSLPDDVKDWLRDELRDLVDSGRAEQYAAEFLQSGVSLSRTFLLVVIYMLFIFAEQVVFRRKMLAVAGDKREEAARVMDTIGRGIQRFVGIKTLTSLATGALGYAVLTVLEVPYALPFAILTFLFNFVPYFGSLIAGALPTITAFANSDHWGTGATVAVSYFMINTIIGSYVEPKIMGRELDLSPLVIIVSVVVWTALWGVVGALLAVPLMATLQIVLASIETTRPIAVMLSSGPPKESGRKPLRRIA